MTSYASIKGQPLRMAPAADKAPPGAELSAAEIERVGANRDFVMQHMPELVDFIKELHAVGLVSGWRSVQNCKLLSKNVAP